MSELLNAAAPWLCLVWLAGVIGVTLINAAEVKRDPIISMTVDMMPWILVMIAISCVAWPGLVIFAVINRKNLR